MGNNQKVTTKNLVMTAMFTAVLAVLSQISIPMPSGVPVTLQTFAVALCACTLGWKFGTGAVAIYLLLGAVGVPVLAGFTGGAAAFAGTTGGFLFGFLPMSVLMGLANPRKQKVRSVFLAGTGLLVCHLLGVLQFMLLMNMNFLEAFLLVSAPYLVKDILSVVMAFGTGAAVKKALNAADILNYA